MKIDLNNKKTINAWALFDWANSAYALVISTAIFPVYFTAYSPDIVTIGTLQFTNSSLYTFAVSFSYIIIAAMSPILSGMADYSGRKKYFLQIFTVIGSLSCCALYFFKGEPQLWLGTSAFILATIGFAGAIVFYNAYLPQIVTEDRYDKVSAKGYAWGYVGSVILLLFILTMIQKPELFNITDPQLPARIGFILVGLWWLGFAQISFKGLPKDKKEHFGEKLIKKGYNEISKVYTKVKKQKHIKRFLASFFFYSAGVQTIIYVAAIFAQELLGFSATELIVIILILQLVGIVGAYLFAYISKITTNKISLLITILIWIAICISAYFCENKNFFYFIAAMVGMVMGGIQSLSRSTYSKMIDVNTEDTTSYFSFYDVLYKLAIVVGTASFALVDYFTHNMRYSVLILCLYFLIGFSILLFTKIESRKVSNKAVTI